MSIPKNIENISLARTIDFRFQYLEDLSAEIGLCCDEFELQQKAAFAYRGMNLRFAVERDLYFSFVNKEPVYQAYRSIRQAGSATGARDALGDELRRRLASGLNLKSHVRAVLGRLRRNARPWLRDALSRWPASPEVRGEALFFLHKPKFVRYMREVLARLGASAGYFDVLGDHSSPALKDAHPVRVLAPPLISHRVPRGLTGFRSLVEEFDSYHKTLSAARPGSVIVVEGNAPQDELVNQAARALGIPTLCVQQGWSPFIHPGFRNLSFDRMIVWGDGFASLLKPASPNQDFVVAGNHVLRPANPDPLKTRKTVCFFLQAPGGLITNEAWDDFIALADWTAGTFPGFDVTVREHPNHALSSAERLLLDAHQNLSLAPADEVSLNEVLKDALLTVSIYSTTILESIAMGVLPIVVNLTAMPRYWPDVAAAGAGIEVDSLEGGRTAIQKCLLTPDYVESFTSSLTTFQAKFFAALGDEAVRNLTEIISESRSPMSHNSDA